MTTYYYSAALLEERGACWRWVSRFREEFGEGQVVLDLAFCKKLRDSSFPVDWPAGRLLGLCPNNDGRLNRLYLRTSAWNSAAEILANLTECAELWAEYHRSKK